MRGCCIAFQKCKHSVSVRVDKSNIQIAGCINPKQNAQKSCYRQTGTQTDKASFLKIEKKDLEQILPYSSRSMHVHTH